MAERRYYGGSSIEEDHSLDHALIALVDLQLYLIHHLFVPLELNGRILSFLNPALDIILAIDGNEDSSDTMGNYMPLEYTGEFIHAPRHNGTLATLVTTCGLVDTLSCLHPPPYPSTYAHGKNRIDYIYVSQDMRQASLRSGVLPLYSTFQGDHNACYLDMDSVLLFGDNTNPIALPTRRGLQLTDPRKVEAYIKQAELQMDYHKIEEKIDLIESLNTASSSSPHKQVLYEKLDKTISDSMIHSERSITRTRTATYEWSLETAQSIQAVRYWKLRLKHLSSLKVTDHILTVTLHKAGLPETAATIVDRLELIEHLRTAREHATHCKKNHVEKREAYLLGLAEAIVSARCPYMDAPRMTQEKAKRVAHEIKELVKRERRRRMYRQIGTVLQPDTFNRDGLSRIHIPASNPNPYPEGPDPKTWKGEWSTVTNPEDIARHTCAANSRQYHQAANTPFATSPLAEYLGPDSTAEGAHRLLQGQLPPNSILDQLQPETITMLRQMALHRHLPPKNIDIHISPEAFISCYKAVRESTSSSPSGRHVGHYKAAIKSDRLTSIHSRMMSIPFAAGFSPQRWHKVIDIMLEKDIGCPRIHRLRILVLLESDFNQAVRIIIARQLGFQMEDNCLVPDMQYGSREGRQCISAVLNKQLTHDIVRHTKTTAAFIENDAVGCYDRMTNNLLILELRRLGLPLTAAMALSDTWANATHHIKTRYGISESFYKNSLEKQLFGPGQGSTLGPFLWLLLFTLIVNSIDVTLPRIVLRSADSSIKIEDIGEAFVDDSFLGCTSTHAYDTTLTVEENRRLAERSSIDGLRLLAQQWERLLFATGGAICLNKSFWYLMSWKWSQAGSATLRTISSAPGTLFLTSGNELQTTVEVPRIETTSSYRTLGVRLSPSGSSSLAYTVLRQQS